MTKLTRDVKDVGDGGERTRKRKWTAEIWSDDCFFAFVFAACQRRDAERKHGDCQTQRDQRVVVRVCEKGEGNVGMYAKEEGEATREEKK